MIRYLFSGWPWLFVLAFVSSLVAGASSISLVLLVVGAAGRSHTVPHFDLFVTLVAAVLAGRAITQILLSRLVTEASFRLRDMLTRRVLGAPFSGIESVGQAQLDTALHDDIGRVASALPRIVGFATNFVVVGGGLIYLGMLYPHAISVVGIAILTGVPLYWFVRRKVRAAQEQRREVRKQLFENLSSFAEGIKELKLHSGRRAHFVDTYLTRTFERLRLERQSLTYLSATGAFCAQGLTWIVVGWLIFTSWDAIAASAAARAAFVVLYVMGPLASLTGGTLAIAEANAALRKIREIAQALGEEPAGTPLPQSTGRVTQVRYAKVVYRYDGEKENNSTPGFGLGPVSLTLRAGRVVFLTGSNGSGKTTLLKLVTGLYWPQSGEIEIDGRPIAADEREHLRSLITAVYDDYHLFAELLPESLRSQVVDANAMLVRFKLDGLVKIDSPGEWKMPKLSRGQRKRLALVNAVLEDRPILVFDEWAADQDPHFKKMFYREILPELRRRGKAVLVITHDEQYFDTADEHIVLQDGKEMSVNAALAQSAA
jgi:putative pyoverdin transport system ATP-binding/permease protein